MRANHGIYHFAFFKVINFVEKFVDKRISMVLRMVYNSMSSTFEGINDILSDITKNGNLKLIQRIHIETEHLEVEKRA